MIHQYEECWQREGRAQGAPGRLSPKLLRGSGWCWRSGGGCRRAFSVIDQILQLLAGLEERNLFRGNFDPVAGLRIASHARFALPRAKAAEAPDLDLVAHAQRAHDAVKDRLYNDFAVFPRKLRQTRDLVNQIRFCHTPLGSVMNFAWRRPAKRLGPLPGPT